MKPDDDLPEVTDAMLARAELRIALEEIHRLVPAYRLDEDRPAVRHSGYVRGVDSLHLVIDPRSNAVPTH